MHPAPDAAPARWLLEQSRTQRPWDELVTVGPGGFEAAARVTMPTDRPETEALASLLAVLADATTTPEHLVACVWTGWGVDVPGAPVVLPHRAYRLVTTSTAELASGVLEVPGAGWPAFTWPQDRAWCLTKDVDPDWACVVGSEAAVVALLAVPDLDVVRVPAP